MQRILMNGDVPVLDFDLEEYDIKVLNNDFLPFALKDFLKDMDACTTIKEGTTNMLTLREYLSYRALSPSRVNSKVILQSAGLHESYSLDGRIAITLACRGLSMIDNIWIKEPDEDIAFVDISLRNRVLYDDSYDAAILGKLIPSSATKLAPDLMTDGMFRKFWKRNKDGLYLYKTDEHSDKPNVHAEVDASTILRMAGANVLKYQLELIDDLWFSRSKCMTSDEYLLVEAFAIRDWCWHTGKDFLAFVKQYFLTDFADMCVCDYVAANTDRHFNNFGFLVENATNTLYSYAPLYDLNQALIADAFKTNIDDLIYEPTNMTFIDTIREYARHATVNFDDVYMSMECTERWLKVRRFK